MIPTFAFDELLRQVGEGFDRKYGEGGYGHRRLVGLVFARPCSPFVKAELLPHLGYWHCRSADHTDFHFAGYRRGEAQTGSPYWEVDVAIPDMPSGRWAYSSSAFDKFRSELEADSLWQYRGGTELVLLNVARDRRGWLEVDYSSAVSCRLDEMKADGAIASVENFFESLFRYAESTRDSDPTWGFSDASGLKLAGSALKSLVLSLLPAKIATHYLAAEHFAVCDYSTTK